MNKWGIRAAATLLFALMPAGPAGAERHTAVSQEAGKEADTSGPDVVAVVNGEPILLTDLERYLGRLHGSVEAAERSGFDIDRLMFKIVNDTLLGQEARAVGMDREPPVAEKVETYRHQQAVRHLERREIAAGSMASDEEVAAAFTELYRSATFRVLTADDQESAAGLLRELQQGADVETLAAQRSVDPYAPRGGLVQNVARIDLQPEIAELVFSLELGESGGPVRTDLGWAVIRVESRQGADPDRLPAVRGKLRALVSQRKATALKASLSATLANRYPVQIDETVVAGIVPKRLPDGRLSPQVEDREAIVARIGDGDATISAAEYADALFERWKGVKNEMAARAAAPIVLQKLVGERLLLVEALARGYAELPELQRAARAYETQLLIPRFLEEVVAADITISEEEKRDYYETHKESFRRPPRVRVAQLTLASEQEAERVANLLRQGTDLAWLAERYSSDGFAQSGGDRGWVEPQPGLDTRSDELLQADVGTVLGPYAKGDRFLVLKVTAREEQGIYPFEKVSGNVREAVYSEKVEQSLDSFMTRLRDRSTIEIRHETLSRLRFSGAQAATS